MVDTYSRGKDIRVMVWGVIWVGRRSDLFIMNKDEASKKKGYFARSYLEVLNDQLPTIYSPGMTFMQDNASIHTAEIIKQWFKDNVIPVLEWPLYSPDLNPIEMVWAWLKEWVCNNYPDLKNMGTSQQAYQRLYSVLQEGWKSIP
jgi:transposase